MEIASIHRQSQLCHSCNHRLLYIDILPLLWLVTCLPCVSYDSVYTGRDCPKAHTIGFVISHVLPVCHVSFPPCLLYVSNWEMVIQIRVILSTCDRTIAVYSHIHFYHCCGAT